MSGLDFNDIQATTLDHVTTNVTTPTLLGQEQEPTQRVELVKNQKVNQFCGCCLALTLKVMR